VTCVTRVPDAHFIDVDNLEAVNVAPDPERVGLQCTICKKKTGLCIQVICINLNK